MITAIANRHGESYNKAAAAIRHGMGHRLIVIRYRYRAAGLETVTINGHRITHGTACFA